MSETSEREAVLAEFRGLGMADEIVRLRRILAALREPSEAILLEAENAPTMNRWDMPTLTDRLRAAVAAAEREVDNA